MSTIYPRRDAPHRVPIVVRAFKAAIARRIRLAGGDGFAWQRNYCERIIRDERELRAIRHYIRRNPARWTDDEEFSR